MKVRRVCLAGEPTHTHTHTRLTLRRVRGACTIHRMMDRDRLDVPCWRPERSEGDSSAVARRPASGPSRTQIVIQDESDRTPTRLLKVIILFLLYFKLKRKRKQVNIDRKSMRIEWSDCLRRNQKNFCRTLDVRVVLVTKTMHSC